MSTNCLKYIRKKRSTRRAIYEKKFEEKNQLILKIKIKKKNTNINLL